MIYVLFVFVANASAKKIVGPNCTLCTINNLGTNESGIDVNQYKRSGAKRQQLQSVGN